MLISKFSMLTDTYCAHQRVQHADSEGRPTGERLGHVQLCVRIILIILIQKLHVGVVSCNKSNF